MKRAWSLLLIISLLLSGCSIGQDGLKEPVTFYYLREHSRQEDHEVFFTDGAIGSEAREASGHRQDLNYLLALYLQGPMDPKLKSTFPNGCKVTEIHADAGELTVTLNTAASRLNDMELTVACACLAKTCMKLTDVETVTVESYDADGKLLFSRSFNAANLILEDAYTIPEETTGETQ